MPAHAGTQGRAEPRIASQASPRFPRAREHGEARAGIRAAAGRDGRYGDDDLAAARLREGVTAATVYPLFAGTPSRRRGARVARTIERDLLAANGLRTTATATRQQ